MRQEPGTRTEDIATIHAEPPDVSAGQRPQRFGRRNYVAGIILFAFNILSALVFAMLTEGKAFTSTYGVLLATISHIAVIGLSASLIIVGAQQARHEVTRADIARNRRRLDQLADEVHELGDALHRRGEQLGPIVEAIPESLAATALQLEKLTGGLHDLDVSVRDQFSATQPVVDIATGLPERIDEMERAVHERFNKLDDLIARIERIMYGNGVLDGILLRREVVGPDDQ